MTQQIPEYEPPTVDDPEPDERDTEAWKRWLEEQPQT